MRAVDFTPVAMLCVVVFCFQLATLLYVGAIWGVPGPGPVSEHEIGRLLAGKYSIEILDDHFSWDVAGGPGQTFGARSAGPDELGRSYPILLEELTRYPVGLVQAIGLKRIVLCSRLAVNGKEKGGVTIVHDGTIFLKVSPAWPVSDGFFRHAIHHEIAHVIDAALGPGREGSWARWNPVDFAYGGDEILSALEITGEDPGGRPDSAGFLNHYSMVDAGEDRAEIFAHMMTLPDVLLLVAAGDPIVARKCLALKSEMVRFHPDFARILRDISPAAVR
jgi:hypothetical protein